ncbi:MAG: nucleotidyltransferase domain-containing protein [Chloroflexota bacterium]
MTFSKLSEAGYLTTMDEKEALVQKLIRLMSETDGILFAYLHGSFLDEVRYHDIDIALFFRPLPMNVFETTMSLSAAWTLAIHKTVDVQAINTASLGFQHYALKGRLLYCRDDTQLTDFIEQVSADYMEFDHHRREYIKDLMES